MMFSTIIDLIPVALAVISIYLLLQWYLRTLTVTEFNQKYVLVTGCDTGFGYLLAKQLDVLGFNVFATCLTKEAISGLHAICTKRLEAFLMDVTKKEDIEKVEKFVRSRLPKNTGLWALVNNAGVMSTLLFPDCYSRKHYTEVMDVNVYGMIDVTTAFLPLLRMSKGRIVNVSSVLGKFTPPIFVPYCISKHAVEAYSNGLRSRQDFAAASTDVQQFYGNKFFESFISSLRIINTVADTNLHRVLSCHLHAISARYPKYRYRAGYDATIIIPLLRMFPVWLSDKILTCNYEIPAGVKKH
ncbi:17-beta-hydroxysteroid dehydrogenase type 6-like isoform X2 [Octopus sinensis]|uniref:17-beta-hydroxysteroid dehydrogenase type 6-like isoform X2 n=1 Tax=Octopus sinensis TaxID=2607531 RepID=A0A7E6F127_9MOLL|nr:17-beta-hydroxysteroid dehydrogenase type 6-like isoform X2 [Octopus sinensis]